MAGKQAPYNLIRPVRPRRPLQGKTYSLFGESAGTEGYYLTVRELLGRLLAECPDEKRLLRHLQRAGDGSLMKRLRAKDVDRGLVSFIKKTVGNGLSVYTPGVRSHLRGLSLARRFDETLATKEGQYHLFMLEIELLNRMCRGAFKAAEYRFALLPHCLRDFRPGCKAAPGDIEEVCQGCTRGCFINLGSRLMEKYGIRAYISVEMDQEGLFKKLKAAHPSIGALGIACVPELARGMRLCLRLGIPAVGVPLDANRCARWMKEARESSFSMEEFEALLGLLG